ncbi:hypothetical protein B0H14DRAFT_3570917 [Mycena olivaceomarginata]|nr:hypothetical protein B0H14DRAFT_3570917 [Mycena olivaceomarginata]
MSDPTLCRGRDADGNQCICMRVKETYIEEETSRVLCKNCDHIESAHPEPKPSIGAFVKGFRDAGKLGVASSSSVKASREEAEAETSAGLRPKKRKSDSTTDTEPPPTKKTNKGRKSQDKLSHPKEGEEVKYGKLVFLPCGIYSDGTLRQPKVPDAAEMETMCQRGLVILSTPDKPLFLNTSWSNKKLNAKFKQLLPGPIGFCEKHPYAGDTDASPEIREQVWMGCIKQGRNLSIAGDVLPTGMEIADHCKIPGHSPSDRVVYLVSKVRIPKPRWSWEEQSDSEDLGSDIETVPSEDLVRTPRKPCEFSVLSLPSSYHLSLSAKRQGESQVRAKDQI